MRRMMATSLRDAGYEVEEARDAPDAWQALRSSRIDLILLDRMLPGASGQDFLQRLRRKEQEEGHNVPVIFVTARTAEEERVRGLDAGADDYVTKPFSLSELRARVRALLRRSGDAGSARTTAGAPRIEAGRLVIDRENYRVLADGVEVPLGPTEFRLLAFLAAHPERVYSRTQILDSAWGRDVAIEERTVDVQVRRVRKALEPHGLAGHIETVRGFGYRFSLAGERAAKPTKATAG